MINDKLSSSNIISDYNRIYSGPGIRTNSAYYKWLVSIFSPKTNSKLLDVSCGEGLFLREVLKKNNAVQTFGLDISDVAISVAKINSPDSRLLVADGQRIPFKDKQFDYVSCLGSIEHYLDPELGIGEIVRVAKDEAKFCIILPNSAGIDLFIHIMEKGDRLIDDFQIIEKTATKIEWISLLERNGVAVEVVHGSNLWPELFQEGTFKIKSISKYLRRLMIKKLCPVNLAREFVFICKKRRRKCF
ncbi:MAG: class I SAM-dependent methyltransferase [Candidatus Omnitrophota bacterium]|jgi:ubiquinone/menaquinone biosynthesis C-methylase UbiE